jgi:hypothetical protein
MVTLAIYALNFIHPGVWLNVADSTGHTLSKLPTKKLVLHKF